MLLKEVVTQDGSITFYSSEYNEGYHSISGAAEEAVKKFAEPCHTRELAAEGSVKILDICFGLGYNTAAALDIALRENNSCKIKVIALEKDITILKQIKKLNPPFESYDLIKKLIRNIDLNKKIKNNNLIKNKLNKIIELNENNVEIKLIIGNALNTIKEIKKIQFNAVFLDPFSPPRNPELWTLDFFKNIKQLMEKDAILATYSCARGVRQNMEKAGFTVTDGPVVGRRSPGTIAAV